MFVVPVVAFALTKRICPGLQRRDRDMLLHGAETGLTSRWPDLRTLLHAALSGSG
ncbi:hypothetical protein GTY85_32045 [Streptomyces sp. SID8377]|nr:hypothetical protein [Streptomyces sp. SID8377]